MASATEIAFHSLPPYFLNKHVITSYSIHYTKLYENRTVYVGIASSTADFHRRIANEGVNTWDTSTMETVTATNSSNFSPTFVPPVGLTYRWGCYVPKDVATMSVSDASGNPQAFFYTPGSITVNYFV